MWAGLKYLNNNNNILVIS